MNNTKLRVPFIEHHNFKTQKTSETNNSGGFGKYMNVILFMLYYIIILTGSFIVFCMYTYIMYV